MSRPLNLAPTVPSLVYHHTDNDTATLVDRCAITSDQRERAICRALLLHALSLLDATELTLMTAAGAGR